MLYATNTKKDLGRYRLTKHSNYRSKHKFFVKTEPQHIKLRLSLKRGFGGCDGLDGFGGFNGLGGFSGLDGVVQSVAERLTLWFRNNCMEVNPDKFHLLLTDKKLIRWIFVIRSFQVHAVKSSGG